MPEDVTHRPKWQLALDMIDELRSWGLVAPAVLDDAAYGDATELRLGLEERDVRYVLDVNGSTSALPESAVMVAAAYSGRGRPPQPRYRKPLSCLSALAADAGPEAYHEICWRQGTRGELTSRFAAIRVRPANVKLRNTDPDSELPVRRLLAEWPAGKDAPTDFWISDLPRTRR